MFFLIYSKTSRPVDENVTPFSDYSVDVYYISEEAQLLDSNFSLSQYCILFKRHSINFSYYMAVAN